MNRLAKIELAKRFREMFDQSPCMLVAAHVGLDAAAVTAFRKKVREAGGRLQVVKNSLVKKALQDQDSDLCNAFKFSAAILFSQEAVSVSKLSVEFSKAQKGKFRIVLGQLEGRVLSSEEVTQIAELPSLKILQGRMLAVLQAPATNMVSLLQASLRDFVRVMEERRKRKKAFQ